MRYETACDPSHESASLGGHPRFPSAHEIDRNWEDDRRTPLTRNVEQRGQVAELHRLGNGCQDPGSIKQFLRRLLLALGIDHLGAASTLGFGLARDRTHHVLVEVDALDLNIGNFDAPGLCLFVEHILDVGIELVTLSQHGVEVMLAEYPAQRRLRELDSSRRDNC